MMRMVDRPKSQNVAWQRRSRIPEGFQEGLRSHLSHQCLSLRHLAAVFGFNESPYPIRTDLGSMSALGTTRYRRRPLMIAGSKTIVDTDLPGSFHLPQAIGYVCQQFPKCALLSAF